MRSKWVVCILCAVAVGTALGALSAPVAMATTCDDTFTGQKAIEEPGHTGWAEKGNWSNKEIPLEGQFACVPESWGQPIPINLSLLPNPVRIVGVEDQSAAALEIGRNTLELTGAGGKTSIIKNLSVTNVLAMFKVDLNNVVTIAKGFLNGQIEGPGTAEILSGGSVNLNNAGLNDGLQLDNFAGGTIVLGEPGGVNIAASMCCETGSLEPPTKIVNSGQVTMLSPYGFGGGYQPNAEIVNEATGAIQVTQKYLRVGVPFVNHGTVTVSPGDEFAVGKGGGPAFTSGGTLNVGTGSFVVQGSYEPSGNPVVALEIAIVKKKGKHPAEVHVGAIRVKYFLQAAGTTLELRTSGKL